MRRLATSLAAVALVAVLGCSSEPQGPVSPALVDSPRTQVTVTPDLAEVIRVPDLPNAQLFERQPDGVLRYQFQLQNGIAEAFSLRINASFFDETGIEVSKDGPTRVHFDPYQIQTITVSSLNSKAHSVRVQVLPAR